MDSFGVNEVINKIMESLQNDYKDLKTLNIMVLGKTGVGKSTLINNVFSKKVADTGTGRPVTDSILVYKTEDYPLAIYDTPGFELGGENALDSLLKQVLDEVKKGLMSGDISQAIHCIWYCVSTPSHRFEQAEIDFLNKFLNQTSNLRVPVIIILTQSFSKADAKGLIQEIEKENLAVSRVVPVLAEDYIIEDSTFKSYGLDVLSEVTNEVIPEEIQKTFVRIQCASLELKKRKAQAIVGASATAAAIIGATPIPFSDAVLLIPEQITMLSGITAVFGIPMEKATLSAIISATIGTSGTTVLGKTIVAGLLKFIPGAGSAIGGAISATTAAALTAALGSAYIQVLMLISNGKLNISDLVTNKGKKLLSDTFFKQLRLKRNKNGEVIE